MTLDIEEVAKRVGDPLPTVGVQVEPALRCPVQLNRFFLESSLRHVALPDLTHGAAAERLRGPDLVGFFFVADDMLSPRTVKVVSVGANR